MDVVAINSLGRRFFSVKFIVFAALIHLVMQVGRKCLVWYSQFAVWPGIYSLNTCGHGGHICILII